jgi:hypothetical protein
MDDHELTRMALRAVAADLAKMLFDRPDITARVSSGAETRFVHGRIRATVEDLQDRLLTLADDEGIDLQVRV